MKQHKMYRKSVILSGILLAFLIAQSIHAQEQKRDVSGFNKISCSISADLEISQANKEELILVGDTDDLEKISTKVEGGELKIYTKNNNTRLGKVKVMVTLKELNEVSLAGSGNVVFKSDLKTEEFEIELSGSGDITCPNITAKEVEISLSGSGNINMGGISEEELEVNIAGSGNIDCANLKAKEVQVNIAGSGDVKVWATDELGSNIVGSGSVYYKGNPLVEAVTSGSGKTKPLK